MYILNIEVSYLSLIHQIKPSENLYDLRCASRIFYENRSILILDT